MAELGIGLGNLNEYQILGTGESRSIRKPRRTKTGMGNFNSLWRMAEESEERKRSAGIPSAD